MVEHILFVRYNMDWRSLNLFLKNVPMNNDIDDDIYTAVADPGGGSRGLNPPLRVQVTEPTKAYLYYSPWASLGFG